MPNKGKVPSIILYVIVLISLSLAGGTFYLFQKEKLKSIALQDELEDVRAKERIIEMKLDDSKKTISQLETQLRESKSQIEFLSTELKKEKKLSQDTLTELEQSKIDLEEHRKVKAELEQNLLKSQQELQKLQAQLKNLEDNKAQLESKIKEMEVAKEQKVELGTIVVPQQERVTLPVETKMKKSTAPSSLEGKILVINKDYDFAVINLGSRDGVNINDIFSIYHKNKYIGDIRIEKVHETMSAANFLSPDIKDKVREGDRVSIKNK